MNKIAIASVLALMTGLAGAPQTAKAHGDDTALAIIGGFIGGVIVANALDNHYDHANAYCEFDGCHDRYAFAHTHSGRNHEWVTVRVWIPGRWVIHFDNYGHRVRYYERGRYEFRRHAVVWDGRRDYDHDRGYRRHG